MTRDKALKIVNPVLGLAVVCQVLSGVFHEFLPREAFENLHGGGGLVVAVAAAIHAGLNWAWIRANISGR